MVGRTDVAVIGAGPAGLAAAWELASRGASVVVVEASGRVGGMAGTVMRDGYRFDYGGHRFLTRWPELLERVQKLLGDDLLVVERHSAILSDGSRIGYPLQLGDLLRQVPMRRAARYVGSYLRERVLRPPRDQTTFEGWMARRFGPALYAEFFAPYTRKLWGIDPRQLSADWAPQRIGRFDLGIALRQLAPGRRDRPRSYARRFLYPRLGMGMLFERIAADIERLGGRILLNTPALGFDLRHGSIRALRLQSGELEARHFIATLPLPDLASALGHASRLRFRGLRLLNLMLEAPAELGSTWVYLSDGRVRVSRVQEPARRSPFMVPPGRGSLQLELPATPGDETWDLEDDELVARSLEEIETVGVTLPRPPRDSFSTRLPRAYPVFDLQARDGVEAALRVAGGIPNLTVCGRQGRFSYSFTDRVMEEGIAAARRWLGIPEGLPGGSQEQECTTETTSLTA